MSDVSTVASNAAHVDILWGALVGCTTLLAGVVGIMYHRINKDIEGESKARLKCHDDMQAKFDRGISSFAALGEKIVVIGEQIKALENKDSDAVKDLEAHECEATKTFNRLETDIKDLTRTLLVISIEHQRCMDREKKRDGVDLKL